MLPFRRRPKLETERMTLRLPMHQDWRAWADLRRESLEFLTQWEPIWATDHLTRRSFTNRVYWAQRAEAQGTALPFLLVRREDAAILGAITLDNIRRGPAQCGTIGYWIGERYSRRGYMHEAIRAVVHHAFNVLDLSRIEAACLPGRLNRPGDHRLAAELTNILTWDSLTATAGGNHAEIHAANSRASSSTCSLNSARMRSWSMVVSPGNSGRLMALEA